MSAVSRLAKIWRRLEDAGLHAILIKGWSTARLYPEPGLRRPGDVDLCFAPEELARAVELRGEFREDFTLTDFHEGVPDLPDRTWGEIFRRTRLERLEDRAIRVLSWEDHLRLTCRHLVRHGGCTPTMLCDVAVLLESSPDNFDWYECLRGDFHERRWILAVIGLARELLGAEIKDAGIRKAARVPAWLTGVLPRVWAAGREKRPFGYYLQRPREGWTALRYRWLNPLRASYYAGMLPKNRLQLAAATLRYFCLGRGFELIPSPLRRRWAQWRVPHKAPPQWMHRELGH